MCKSVEETVSHLLMHYHVPRDVWCMILGRFGMDWVMVGNTLGNVRPWRVAKVRNDVLDIWNVVPLCLWWNIWKERNSRTSENIDDSHPLVLKFRFLSLLYS